MHVTVGGKNDMELMDVEQMYAGNYVDGKCLLPLFFFFFRLYCSEGMSLIKTGRQIANKWLGDGEGGKHISEKEY